MNLITIPPGLETESFVLEADALRHAPEILRKHWGAGPDAWIVADENTWTAAGEKLNAIFEEAGIGRCAPYLSPAGRSCTRRSNMSTNCWPHSRKTACRSRSAAGRSTIWSNAPRG